jgi:TonB family protein
MFKKLIITTTLFLSIITNNHSQNIRAVIKYDKLNSVKYIIDLYPELWDKMYMPYNDRFDIDQLKKATYTESFNGARNYNCLIYYVSVEIIASCQGKTITATGLNDKLTEKQKKILSQADVGTDVIVKVRFKHKGNSRYITNREIVEGFMPITVVPYVEAEFLNDGVSVTEFLREKIRGIKESKNIEPAVVKFIVNEQGKAINAKIEKTSKSSKIDKILLEAITNMPKWKPAKNSKGVTVKQDFCIQLGGGC